MLGGARIKPRNILNISNRKYKAKIYLFFDISKRKVKSHFLVAIFQVLLSSVRGGTSTRS
jgi:hypothetical protein